MSFSLGASSRQRLTGVHKNMVELVELAIQHTGVDFSVHEGLRTPERQQGLVAAGASKTMNSRHLTGHAVDLVPFIEGELRWDWPLCLQIADAMRSASQELDIPVIWGGVWDIELDRIEGDLEEAMHLYAGRMRARGKRPFLDGPHYELPRRLYPA